MKTQHTQINWKIDDAKDLPLAIIEDTEDGYGICELDLLHENKETNAKLIAAAPELLEALKQCRQWLRDYQDGSEEDRCKTELSWADQAIKKATT